METNGEYPLSQAKKEVELAQERLLGVYISRIQEVYKRSDIGQRQTFCQGLDKLLEDLEGRGPSKFGINPEEAQRVRRHKGLTQAELAEAIGIKGSHHAKTNTIMRYESTKAKFHHLNPRYRAYLEWLKQQGYNPFGI